MVRLKRGRVLLVVLVVALAGVGVAAQRGVFARKNPEAKWDAPATSAELERWYKALADDHRPYGEWIVAAELITRPRDEHHEFDERGTDNVWSVREKGAAPAPALGEPLRERQPRVSDLIQRRIAWMYATTDSQTQRGALSFAKLLVRWDAAAARTTMQKLARELPQKYAAERADYRRYWGSAALELAEAREHLGDRQAFSEAARWVASLSFVEQADTMGYLAEHRRRPEVAELCAKWFDPTRRDLPILSDEFSLQGMVTDYTLVLPSLREYVLGQLGDRNAHGAIEIEEGGSVVRKSNWSRSYDLPPEVAAGKQRAFPLRVCDQYAIDLSSIQGAPKFEAWRSESERDAQIEALAVWVRAQPLRDRR